MVSVFALLRERPGSPPVKSARLPQPGKRGSTHVRANRSSTLMHKAVTRPSRCIAEILFGSLIVDFVSFVEALRALWKRKEPHREAEVGEIVHDVPCKTKLQTDAAVRLSLPLFEVCLGGKPQRETKELATATELSKEVTELDKNLSSTATPSSVIKEWLSAVMSKLNFFPKVKLLIQMHKKHNTNPFHVTTSTLDGVPIEHKHEHEHRHEEDEKGSATLDTTTKTRISRWGNKMDEDMSDACDLPADLDTDVEMSGVQLEVKAVPKKSLADLPYELHTIICEHLDDETRTLAFLARGCQRAKDAALRVLYDNIVVSNDSLDKLSTRSEDNKDGVIGHQLRALAQNWIRKNRPSPQDDLTCKNMSLLDFSRHGEQFFDNVIGGDYAKEVMEHAKAFRSSSYDFQLDGNNDTRTKALLVASFSKLRNLKIDIFANQAFFTEVAVALVEMEHEAEERSMREEIGDRLEPTSGTDYGNNMTAADVIRQEMSLSLRNYMMFPHFSALQTIELRTTETVLLSAAGEIENAGTIIVQGSWAQYPALHTVKYYGHTISKDFSSAFLDTCVPNSIELNGWKCDDHHQVFEREFNTSREAFQNSLESFTWKNMGPCIASLDLIHSLLHDTQRASLKTLSLIRERPDSDLERRAQRFLPGTMAFQDFKQLEYLDIDSRFLIPSQKPSQFGPLTDWLHIPQSLRILSIDCVTSSETSHLKGYLDVLLEALKTGLFRSLREVRCGFLGFKGGRKVFAWSTLGNLPGLFLGYKVKLEGWEYDIDDDEVEEARSTTVRVGRRRRAGHRG